jgi:excisionase family DNA binding protein
MPTDARSGETPERRKGGRPKGGRRATDPIDKLETHSAGFVSLSQLVDYWAVNDQTLLRFIHDGKLPAYRFGRDFRVKREDAMTFERMRLFVKRRAS